MWVVRRREFGQLTQMIDRLLAMDPFQLPADAEHYASGLHKAGFE
jgi:hypothetical protein